MGGVWDWRMAVQIIYLFAMYFILFYGVWRLLKLYVRKIFYTTREIARMPSVRTRYSDKKENRLRKHLELLLESTSNKKPLVEMFYLKTILIFMVVTVVLISLTRDVQISIFVALISSLVPYILLWVKLNRIRAISSYDLLPATNKLLQKYRSNNFNLYFALKETVGELEGPIQSAFSSILYAIQHRRNVEDSIQVFHYQIKTTWSLQLGILIAEGITENKNIDDALSRITRDMTETSIVLEKEKSESRDAIQLGYFPIFALPITILLNQKISDGRAFHYHFYVPEGLKVLILTSVICLFSFLAALILAKPRNDI